MTITTANIAHNVRTLRLIAGFEDFHAMREKNKELRVSELDGIENNFKRESALDIELLNHVAVALNVRTELLTMEYAFIYSMACLMDVQTRGKTKPEDLVWVSQQVAALLKDGSRTAVHEAAKLVVPVIAAMGLRLRDVNAATLGFFAASSESPTQNTDILLGALMFGAMMSR